MIVVRNKKNFFKKKYNFLACFDKDGTLVIDSGYVHKIEDFQWHINGLKLLRIASQKNAAIVVVTNQSGISKKIFTKQQSIQFARYLMNKASQEKICIKLVIICPHDDDQYDAMCECRKPSPGMFVEVKRLKWARNLDSVMIGNTKTDKDFANSSKIAYLDVNNPDSVNLLENW